jgi:hypothetical protein
MATSPVPGEGPVRPASVFLHEGTIAALAARTGKRSMSAYVEALAQRELERELLRELIQAAETEHGPVDDTAVEAKRALLSHHEVDATDEHQFSRTRTVVRLFSFGVEFISRSEAKRLMHGLERFSEVLIDFAGVEAVGQGFVDEALRVWPNQHPQTAVQPIGMTGPVEFMVRRGLPQAGTGN